MNHVTFAKCGNSGANIAKIFLIPKFILIFGIVILKNILIFGIRGAEMCKGHS